ncbi:MAG: hypothetical protein SOZ40_07010 [Ezakiella sp.]|nr:hypothetical protein [Ezakiella sp.]
MEKELKRIEQLKRKENNLRKRKEKAEEEFQKVNEERLGAEKETLYKFFEKQKISLEEYLEMLDMTFEDKYAVQEEKTEELEEVQQQEKKTEENKDKWQY